MPTNDDPRIDPRIKAVLAFLPATTQPDVESREALLAELNTPEALASARLRSRCSTRSTTG